MHHPRLGIRDGVASNRGRIQRQVVYWRCDLRKKKTPGSKGIKPGVKPQFVIKAPAQGGEAGDETVCA
jgi:hypothetical protein